MIGCIHVVSALIEVEMMTSSRRGSYESPRVLSG